MCSGTSNSPRISTVRQARIAPLEPEIPTMIGWRCVVGSALMRDLQGKARRVMNLRAHDDLAAHANLPLDRARVTDYAMYAELGRQPCDEGATRAPPNTRAPREYFALRVVVNIVQSDRTQATVECRSDDLWCAGDAMNGN